MNNPIVILFSEASMFHKGGDGRAKGFGFSGFSIAPRGTGPESQLPDAAMTAATRAVSMHYGKKRVKDEEE
jgi:hypothetical protein